MQRTSVARKPVVIVKAKPEQNQGNSPSYPKYMEEVVLEGIKEYRQDLYEDVEQSSTCEYNDMMNDVDAYIDKVADSYNVPISMRAEFRTAVTRLASSISKAAKPSRPSDGRLRPSQGKRPRPDLPSGLSWPKGDYGDSPEGRGQRNIIGYLTRVWLPILDAGRRDGCIYVDRRIIADWYPGVITAIANYRRPDKRTGAQKEIPPKLRFPSLKEVNDQAIAAHPDVARVAANRAKRGALTIYT